MYKQDIYHWNYYGIFIVLLVGSQNGFSKVIYAQEDPLSWFKQEYKKKNQELRNITVQMWVYSPYAIMQCHTYK